LVACAVSPSSIINAQNGNSKAVLSHNGCAVDLSLQSAQKAAVATKTTQGPTINAVRRHPDDEFIVLASSGVWMPCLDRTLLTESANT